MFGKEHTVNQLRHVFDEDVKDFVQEADVAAYEEPGDPLYARDDWRETKYPSPTLWKSLREAIQLNLNDDEWVESSDDDDDTDLL